MEKFKTRFICQNCGFSSLKWIGKCPSCEQWDTLVEEVVRDTRTSITLSGGSLIRPLGEITANECNRMTAGINEFDRLLGGGIVPGSVILLGGEPGVGKSTLLLQVASSLSGKNISVLYISGEESAEQIKLRSERLKIKSDNLFILSETNIETIINHIECHKPQFVIVDSVQIIYSQTLSSAPGTVAQVRESTGMLTNLAKKKGLSICLIGHVTKTGAIAGPRVIEHLVDVVLYFEGDMHNRYRILRTLKNRFGSTEEIGIFNMQPDGLHEVSNPSDIFLSRTEKNNSGSVVVASIEGTRPLLVEIQALVSPTIFGMPERRSAGLDYRRLAVLLAVLEKRAGLKLGNQDVFVNVAGGLKLNEPAVDLGVVLAVISSFREIPVPSDTVAVGEVGLGGEVRAVNHIDRRIIEAERLGFKKVILPQKNKEQIHGTKKIELIPVDSINSAMEELFARPKSLLPSALMGVKSAG